MPTEDLLSSASMQLHLMQSFFAAPFLCILGFVKNTTARTTHPALSGLVKLGLRTWPKVEGPRCSFENKLVHCETCWFCQLHHCASLPSGCKKLPVMVGSIGASDSRGNSERTPLLGNGRAAFNGTYGTAGQDALPAPEARDTAIQETQLSHDAGVANGNGQGRRSGSEPRKGGLARQVAPDLLRGLLMVFMALDHVSVCELHYEPETCDCSDGRR